MGTTPYALAKECVAMLETKTRDNGARFTAFKDGRPDWMLDLARAAHGDMLPDDQRYEMISDALYLVGECASPREVGERIEEIEPDPYTSDRLAWLSSRNDRTSYVDEAVAEFGHADTIEEDIGLGQMLERQEVARAVWDFLEERAEDADDAA
jgi:hypothetical protein